MFTILKTFFSSFFLILAIKISLFIKLNLHKSLSNKFRGKKPIKLT